MKIDIFTDGAVSFLFSFTHHALLPLAVVMCCHPAMPPFHWPKSPCALHTNQPQVVEVITSKKRPREIADDLVLVLYPIMLCMQLQSASGKLAQSHDRHLDNKLVSLIYKAWFFFFQTFVFVQLLISRERWIPRQDGNHIGSSFCRGIFFSFIFFYEILACRYICEAL